MKNKTTAKEQRRCLYVWKSEISQYLAQKNANSSARELISQFHDAGKQVHKVRGNLQVKNTVILTTRKKKRKQDFKKMTCQIGIKKGRMHLRK